MSVSIFSKMIGSTRSYKYRIICRCVIRRKGNRLQSKLSVTWDTIFRSVLLTYTESAGYALVIGISTRPSR